MKIFTTIGLALCMGVSSVSAQLVSSDPDFAREGPAPYACTTPKGKKTTCNRWHGTVRQSGWQRKCVYPDIDSMLMKLPGDGSELYLEPPDTGCAMLFSDVWADTRNWAAKNQAKERRRTLKAGQLNQYVQVTQAGIHEFGACMVRNVAETAGAGGGTGASYVNSGGMVAMLIQWHPNDTATVQAVLPNNKTRFGPVEDPLVNVPNRVPSPECLTDTPETSVPGDEIGCEIDSSVSVYYADGRAFGIFRADQMWGQVLDGIEGHSGTGSKYGVPGILEDPGAGNAPFDAFWTCYDVALHLDPGFYALRVEVQPFFYNVAPVFDANGVIIDGTYVSDYTGYGALSNVYLNRVP